MKKNNFIVSVVEDNIKIGQSLKNYLNDHTEYECDYHYENAASAIKGILKHSPDIVIMDIGLPDTSGVVAMREILAKQVKTKFLMFTIFDHESNLFDALKNGADGYILKDASFHEITSALNELTLGGGPMSPSIAFKVIKSFQENTSASKIEDLTKQQLHILELISKGLMNKEISAQLNIKEGTVKAHVYSIYKKLQVNNRVEASMLYKENK